MKKSLKIVHTMSSLKGGGMEHFVLRLAHMQKKHGHQSSVLSIQGGPLKKVAGEFDVAVEILDSDRKIVRVLQCVRHMASLRPDIIHAHNPTSLQYAAIGRIAGGSRLLLTDHAQTRGIVRIPTKLEWRLTNAVVAVSQDTASKTPDLGYSGDVSVILNGITMREAKRSREEVRNELGLKDEIAAINVAGLVAVKAHDVLIKAVAKLRDDGVPMTVLIVGDGPERENLEKMAEDFNLGPEWIRFLGFRSDVDDLLQASDIFVLQSRLEGLPISILEAMSHKLPVVVTPSGGTAELVEDGKHGVIVPIEDHEALAAALKDLASDPERRKALGEAGYKHVADNFSFDRMARKYEKTYYRMIGE